MNNCRICNIELTSVLNLGDIYPSNFVPSTSGKAVPLELAVCPECNLVQLNDTVNLDDMYRKYWYKSGLNPTMVEALKDVVQRVRDFGYTTGNVLDIGANDGTLLKLFGKGYHRVGIDPALNFRKEAIANSELFINDYFPSERIPDMKFDVITSIAMFYDLPDPKSFVEAIVRYLKDDGMWVVQFTDLKSMFKLNAFDNICHEHLEYYSLQFLHEFFSKYNLSIFHIEYNEVNGGSIRLYIDKGITPIYNSVNYYSYDEEVYINSYENPFAAFKKRVHKERRKLLVFISKQVGKIYVLGASTKGNTLLQYYTLDSQSCQKALEINSEKYGLKTIGSEIPIVPEDRGLKDNPEFLLILPWHFKDFFAEKLHEYLENGGKLIVPLPTAKVGYYGKYGKIVWEEI